MRPQLVVGSDIYMIHFPKFIIDDLADTLRFLNPNKVKALQLAKKVKKMKYVANQMPEYIEQVVYELSSQAYRIPIGHLDTVKDYLELCDTSYDYIDQRHDGKDADRPCTFREDITLRDYQDEAVCKALDSERGLIVIPARGGKTLTASNLISRLNKKTVWIVHNSALFRQTHRELEKATGRQWYRIGDGKNEFTMEGDYFICMVQTLKNRPKVKEWMIKNIGLVLIDECHHVPASQFLEALSGFRCKRVLGLTATPFRQDGWGDLITSMLGDPIYEVTIDMLKDEGVLVQPDIIPVYTTFTGLEDMDIRDVSGYTYTQLVTKLTEDYERNQLIAHTVSQTIRQGMIVSKRVEHAEAITEMLCNLSISAVCITGKTKDREEILDSFRAGNIQCIVASIQLVQEGLDVPNLEQIYFATPIVGDRGKDKGSAVQQAVSRVMTRDPSNPHKQSQVYFFVDYNNDMLQKQWYTVRRTLKRMGITVPNKPKTKKADELMDLIDMLG